MTVLITGAFGFVGSNLSAYLAAKGYELWALDVMEEAAGPKSNYARRFTWQALDAIPWPQVDAIIHLAGKAHDTRNTGEAQAYFEINAGLTRRVLDAWRPGSAASDSPRRRIFILFSSVKAVADAVDGVLTEEAIPAPRTPYGESKLAAEREVLKFGSAGVRECQGATTLSRALSKAGFSEQIFLRLAFPLGVPALGSVDVFPAQANLEIRKAGRGSICS